MKSTKRILSAILSLCMIFGCLAVGFSAQASAADLVELIAGNGDVNWTGGDVTLTDTLTITGNKKVDLNGAVITGPEGKNAVVINGDVTLYDGVVIANNKAYSGETGFIKSLVNYRPAISVNGGNVVLECVTAVGSVIRIPNSSTVEIPVGNGINANNGSVTLKNVIAMGMKALDNTKASVVVEDAILIGIYKAVNQMKGVDFSGKTSYTTVDFLEGFLADGVTLSASEKKYIDAATNSQGDFSFASVLVNVADPSFGEITSTYVNNVLNVFAQADVSNEVDGVSNRYSYAYNPSTCEVDGQVAEFELVNGQYVAQFEGLEENNEFEAKANYDFSVKLGAKQKDVIEGALDMIADYVEKAPALLYRFVKDFEALKKKAEMYAGLVYNALVDDLSKDMFNLPEVESLVLALFGETYTGYSDDGSEYPSPLAIIHDKGPVFLTYVKEGRADLAANFIAAYRNSKLAIFDTDGDGVKDAPYAYTDDTQYAADEYVAGKPGYGSGIGLLEVFDDYYADLKGYIYGTSTTEFNDLEGAAEYVARNWEEIYDLIKYAVDLCDTAYEVVNNNEDGIGELLEYANLGSFASYIDMFNKVAAPNGYMHKIMDRADEALASETVQKYIGDEEKAVYYCTTYTKKAWKIVNNLDMYFDIDVSGDYVNVDFGHFTTGTVNTNVVEEGVRVSLDISGQGYASIDGESVGSYFEKFYQIGEEYTISGDNLDNLDYIMVVTEGGRKIVEAPYTAKAATNVDIIVVFKSVAQQIGVETQVTLMTDKALGFKYIQTITLDGSLAYDDLSADWADKVRSVSAPTFKGLTLQGWSVDKDSDAPEAKLADVYGDLGVASSAVVYAIYDYEEQVEVPVQSEAIKMNGVTVSDKVYFEVSIQLKDAKAVEAGVIVTKNASLATKDKMTVDLSGEAGVAFLRTNKKDSEGFVNPNVVYTAGVKTASGTVYGRGYVVYANGTVEYTEIVSGTI